MNWKKHLKLKTDAEVPYSERDRQFYERLLTDVESGEIQSKSGQQSAVKAKAFNLQKALLLLGAFLVAVGIVCGLVFGLPAQKMPLYQDKNIVQKEITFDEFNLEYFDLSQFESASNKLNLYYDKVTGDRLYYSFGVTTGLANFNLTIVTNKYYKFEFTMDGEIKTQKLADYSVKYVFDDTLDTNITYKGLIKVKTETVYFIYNQSPADGEQAFLNSIEQLIKIKE